MINIICALAQNRAIGYKNELIYHLRADLKRFKELTTGHTIIMGRRTFESLPKGALPNRRNIVLSRNENITFTNAERFSNLSEALSACKDDEEIFIIGGASVYSEAYPLAGRLYLTHIEATPQEADVFFPDFNKNEWEIVAAEFHEADDKNPVPYHFIDYARKDRCPL